MNNPDYNEISHFCILHKDLVTWLFSFEASLPHAQHYQLVTNLKRINTVDLKMQLKK